MKFSSVLYEYLNERDRQNSDYYDGRAITERGIGRQRMEELCSYMDAMICSAAKSASKIVRAGPETEGTVPDYKLEEYSSKQWWFEELEKILNLPISGGVTDDMKRAAGVARNLMLAVEAQRSKEAK